MIKILVRDDFTVPVGLEWESTHYPESGAYYVNGKIMFVNKITNVSTMVDEETSKLVMGSSVNAPPGGGISEEGLLKLMAILQNPDNAVSLLK